MSLFPSIPGYYYDDKDHAIKKQMEDFYTNSININQSFWVEADIDQRFEAGDQTLYWEIYNNLTNSQRRTFNFNRIRRIVNMIDGYQRRNRKSTIVTPIENGDEETADQFTKILYWINQHEGVLETISDGFHGALVTGLTLLQVWMDYRQDPASGNIKVDNCSYNTFLIDPFFRKQDLSDCNHIWKRSFLSIQECVSLLPDKADQILQLAGNDIRDGKFEFMPETFNYDKSNLLIYDEYYYRTFRTQKLLFDTQTGETMEWSLNDKERLDLYLKTYPQVTVIESEIPTVRLAIVVQGKVMYDGPQPSGLDDYPFVPIFGYYNPNLPYFHWRVQGVVRGLRDAQFLYNRRKIIELDIMESQINSGFIYKEGTLINPNDVYLTGQGRGVGLKRDAQMTDIQQIQAPSIPPAMIQLSEILGREIQEISGVNEELLGSATDDKAGILSMLRQGAGLTTLQLLFDKLDFAQKRLGSIMLKLIQLNFTPGKVQRILNEQPSDQFYNKAFGRYDAAVEEGLNTTTQKQLQFAQLMQLREAGIPIPNDVIIQAATIQDKKKLIEAIEAQQKQQEQISQMQLESEMKLQQAQTELANARTIADKGLGIERLSRVQENQALADERKAQADKDEEEALLTFIKSVKEIQHLDLEAVSKTINMLGMLKNVHENNAREASALSGAGSQTSNLSRPSQQATADVARPLMDEAVSTNKE
jgi:hypothetical protein